MSMEVHTNRSKRYCSVGTHEKKNVTQMSDKGRERESKLSTQEQRS